MKTNNKKKKKTTKTKKNTKNFFKPIYVSYNCKIVFILLIFVISFSLCLYFATNSFKFKHPEKIKYTDIQNIDYQVYLKPNDFYKEKYLGKNMMYVANLIDYININFNYNFNIEKQATVDFNYEIIGRLTIFNPSTKANYFEKDYELMKSNSLTMDDENNFSINQEIKIDYDEYNNLANTFRTKYGVSAESSLKIYFKVYKNGKNYNLNENSQSELIIPLSENAIQIKFDAEGSNNINEFETKQSWILQPNIFTLEIITFIISVVCLSKLLKMIFILIKKKSPYDKYIKKILKIYDRLIVETKTGLNFNEYHLVEIDKFEELLDVRDNLKLPIMYFTVVPHQKCHFYIKNNNDVYLLTIKAINLERKQNEKKKKR